MVLRVLNFFRLRLVKLILHHHRLIEWVEILRMLADSVEYEIAYGIAKTQLIALKLSNTLLLLDERRAS